jgi:hypothetical protein
MDDRIPERGPNGGSYPGYEHFNRDEIPEFTPDTRRKRNILALGLSLACLLAALGLGVWMMESAGEKAAHALEANSGGVRPTPTFQPSDTPAVDPSAFFGMQMGFCAVDADKHGMMKVCVYRARRVVTCSDGSVKPDGSGRQFLLLLIHATVIEGVVNVNPNDWTFIPSGAHAPIDMTWANCVKSAGMPRWPGKDGVPAGSVVDGYLAFDVAAGSGGRLGYAPDLSIQLASWDVPSQ